MESEEQSPEYVEYDSLTGIEEGVDAIVAQVHSDNWKVNFEGMNGLRRLNKFRKTEIVNSIGEVIEQISVFIDSPRSSLCKLSLILVTEIFSGFEAGLIPIVAKLGNLLLLKSTNEKSFIKVEANKAIRTIAENFYSVGEIVEIYRAGCYHKSTSMSQNAFTCLMVVLGKIPEGEGIEICLSLENCARQSVVLGAKEFIKKLSVSWDGFQGYLEGLEESKRKVIEGQLAEKGRRTSLRDTIKAAKVLKKVNSTDCLGN